MEKQIKIALAGNPNCGKTTLFNALTGSNQFVGNWPGVTVEKKEGKLKKHDDVIIMDLPGIYSLSPYTLEEVVARNYLITERPDAILNIIDGTNLERNLYLTTQLTELGIPVVIAINMMDVVRKNGDQINVAELSRELEEQTSREVSLAASSIPMQYILPQLISEFHRENPDFRFLLRSGDSAAVHAAITRMRRFVRFLLSSGCGSSPGFTGCTSFAFSVILPIFMLMAFVGQTSTHDAQWMHSWSPTCRISILQCATQRPQFVHLLFSTFTPRIDTRANSP